MAGPQNWADMEFPALGKAEGSGPDEHTHLPHGERGSVSDARESRRQAAGVPSESWAPVAAVDLPCPVGSLDDMEGNRAGLHRHAAAAATDLPPALSRDARQATVPGEPGGGRSRRWLTAPVRYQRQRES